jgi:predicted nucleic acid-binding protein
MAPFFADSYAIIEILKGNEHYRKYQTDHLIATEFNICEVAFAVCRDYPDKTHSVMALVRKMVSLEPATDEDYCSAAAMRRTTTSTGKKFSTIDCVGYSVARRLEIPFLTGDREFEDIDNVVFVR